jgi:hypothetical protein
MDRGDPMTDLPALVFGELCQTPESGCQRHGCGTPLTGRQRRWCSGECRDWHYRNHRWTQARHYAMVQADWKCRHCGEPAKEVDHIIERRGLPLGENSCLHHQENLRPLCHACHLTRYQWETAS